ncbi:MAG: hypothetical protein JWO67_3000 [Streptosporangiaceae bacterium]|nr:hypothetical protein [Streptosporangiaceae bacterium]
MNEYETACGGKRRYLSRALAKRESSRIRREGGGNLRAYACNFCGQHHLGHRPGEATYLREDRTSPTRTRIAGETPTQ